MARLWTEDVGVHEDLPGVRPMNAVLDVGLMIIDIPCCSVTVTA